VPIEEWGLVACVVFSGLWSGLLAMLTLVMHRMLRRMDGPGFRRFLGEFLPAARTSWFNYACVLGMVFASAVVLWTLDSGTTSYTLTVFGLALTAIGPLAVSNRLAEPNYDAILAWEEDAMPADWEATRRRYFTLNWVRAACTWGAFALFLAALVDLS
jgi:hypothetical protein